MSFFFVKRMAWDSNPGPSDCEATRLTTRPAMNVIDTRDRF